jgi:hypothetical protein
VVEFVAHHKVNGRGARLHEVSRFVREAGAWLYVDGVTEPDEPIDRDAPADRPALPHGSPQDSRLALTSLAASVISGSFFIAMPPSSCRDRGRGGGFDAFAAPCRARAGGVDASRRGCAALPRDVVRTPSTAIPASADTELGRIALASTTEPA